MESYRVWSLKNISIKTIYTCLKEVLFQDTKQEQDTTRLLMKQ